MHDSVNAHREAQRTLHRLLPRLEMEFAVRVTLNEKWYARSYNPHRRR